MRKILVLLLCLSVLLLSACSADMESVFNDSQPAEAEKTLPKEVNLIRDVPDLDSVRTVTVPYKRARSIDISGRCLYLSVYDPYEASGTNQLVSYDVGTCVERVLFELPYNPNYDDCFIQGVQTDGEWLVWEVCSLMTGHFNSIYAMDILSGEIELAKEMSSLNSSSPVYSNGKVLWSETDEEKTAIYKYDCESEKTTKLADVDSGIVDLAADKDKAVWYADGEYTVYDLTDGETEKIKTDAESVKALALKGDKIYSACDDKITVTDIATKQSTQIKRVADSLLLTDNYVVAQNSKATNFYSVDNLVENETLVRYYVEAMGTDENRLVTVAENEGQYANEDGSLIDQLWVHIYDFDKLREVE